jgi:hypothetical protein
MTTRRFDRVSLIEFKEKCLHVWKPKKVKRRLIMCMDVGLEESCKLSLCALVGRFAYKARSNLPFNEWMQITWVPLIGYSPKLLTLPRGWFGLVFRNLEDSTFILDRFWEFEGGSIMLKHWRTRFDPATEYFSFRHVWVLLPGLSLQLWNKKSLEAIGNMLGRFLKVDEAGFLSMDKRMARVLVELDIHVGLLEMLELEWHGKVTVQRLDYLGLPFRCSICRWMGHLCKDCHFMTGVSDSEESLEASTKDFYMSEADSEELGVLAAGSVEDTPGPISDTFIGKLKTYCPALYFSLSSWERDLLDNSFSSLFAPLQVVVSGNLGTTEPGGTYTVPDRTPLHPVSLDTSVSLPEEPSLTTMWQGSILIHILFVNLWWNKFWKM